MVLYMLGSEAAHEEASAHLPLSPFSPSSWHAAFNRAFERLRQGY
jgi:hypothetical protein